MRKIGLVFSVVLPMALQSPALTIHRSFRTREAGFGFGTGRAGVAYPVDARIDKAIDEARQKEAEKLRIIIGRVTKILDGDTINVVTGGNELYTVRLDRVDVPEKGRICGGESAAHLGKLVNGRIVRVEWTKKDKDGRVLGAVWLNGSRPVSIAGRDRAP